MTARQEGIWFFEELSPGTSVHHLSEGYRIRGDLDVQALHRAFDALAMRHEILRAKFGYPDGRPMQIVAKAGTVPVEEIDMSAVPPEDREHEAARRCSAFAQRTFDLVEGPLARALLIKLSEDEHILQVTVHGIVADEASFAILWRDLGSSYRAAVSGTQCSAAPAIQWCDFAAWHRPFIDGPALKGQRAYWSETLKNGIPALHLPFDHRRPVAAFAGARVETSIERDCMDAIARIAGEGGCRPFVALMTAYVTFLHRYSGDRTIAAAFSVSGRTFPETEALIGPFANTVLLVTQVDVRASFTEFMQTVEARESDAYDNQDVPIEHVLRTLRSAGLANHIQTRLTAYDSHRAALTLPGATTVRYAPSTGTTSRTDLSFEIRDGEAPTIVAEYDTAVFERPTVERMLANFTTLLRGIADDPRRPLGALPLLAEAERRLVVVDWNANEAPRTGPQLLHRIVEGQVRARGAAQAVVNADGGIAYDELDRQANRLARMLRALGVGRESLVGVCLDRSIDAIVVLLAVAKAGGAFVPLDPSYPDDRLAVMLADAAPHVLITTRHLTARLVTPTSTTVRTIEELFADSVSQPDGVLPDVVEPDDAAYVIYTSGSTGVPKGVVVSHRSACNMLLSARADFGFNECDRVLQLAPLSFDPSVWQIFGTLAVGGCIVLPTRRHVDRERCRRSSGHRADRGSGVARAPRGAPGAAYCDESSGGHFRRSDAAARVARPLRRASRCPAAQRVRSDRDDDSRHPVSLRPR
jgi:non-ribosomal peptide synthetase component F